MLGVFRVNERTREIYGRIFRSEIWEALGQLLDGGRSINVPLGTTRTLTDACRRLLDLVNSRDSGTGIP